MKFVVSFPGNSTESPNILCVDIFQYTSQVSSIVIVAGRFRVIFVQVLPCISLVILNILLFSAMRRAEQRRRRLTINRTNNNLKKNNAAKQKRGTVGR